MKTNKKYLMIVLHSITSVLFLLFIYFSYFAIKELLVLDIIKKEEYVAKFYPYKIEQCSNRANEWIYDKDIDEVGAKKRVEFCKKGLMQIAENKKVADFKYNFIKYALAMVFSLILFLFFAFTNLFYKKNLCTKK